MKLSVAERDVVRALAKISQGGSVGEQVAAAVDAASLRGAPSVREVLSEVDGSDEVSVEAQARLAREALAGLPWLVRALGAGGEVLARGVLLGAWYERRQSANCAMAVRQALASAKKASDESEQTLRLMDRSLAVLADQRHEKARRDAERVTAAESRMAEAEEELEIKRKLLRKASDVVTSRGTIAQALGKRCRALRRLADDAVAGERAAREREAATECEAVRLREMMRLAQSAPTTPDLYSGEDHQQLREARERWAAAERAAIEARAHVGRIERDLKDAGAAARFIVSHVAAGRRAVRRAREQLVRWVDGVGVGGLAMFFGWVVIAIGLVNAVVAGVALGDALIYEIEYTGGLIERMRELLSER